MNVKPEPKVTAAGAGGFLGVLIVWVLTLNHVDVPPEVATAIGGLLAFAGGWIKK